MHCYEVEVVVRCRVETKEPVTEAELLKDTEYLVHDALKFCEEEAGFEHNKLPKAYTKLAFVHARLVETLK